MSPIKQLLYTSKAWHNLVTKPLKQSLKDKTATEIMQFQSKNTNGNYLEKRENNLSSNKESWQPILSCLSEGREGWEGPRVCWGWSKFVQPDLHMKKNQDFFLVSNESGSEAGKLIRVRWGAPSTLPPAESAARHPLLPPSELRPAHEPCN